MLHHRKLATTNLYSTFNLARGPASFRGDLEKNSHSNWRFIDNRVVFSIVLLCSFHLVSRIQFNAWIWLQVEPFLTLAAMEEHRDTLSCKIVAFVSRHINININEWPQHPTQKLKQRKALIKIILHIKCNCFPSQRACSFDCCYINSMLHSTVLQFHITILSFHVIWLSELCVAFPHHNPQRQLIGWRRKINSSPPTSKIARNQPSIYGL